MARFRYFKPGERIFDYTGKAVRDSNYRVVQKSLFGHGANQIKVIAMGARKDEIKLVQNDTGKTIKMTRYEYERLKEELKQGHFKSGEVFFKAAYANSYEGIEGRNNVASENFEYMLDSRYEKDPHYYEYKEYIVKMFDTLSPNKKAQFMKDNEKLIRDLWEYDYVLDMEEYGYTKDTSELEMLRKELEKYFPKDKITRMRITTKFFRDD